MVLVVVLQVEGETVDLRSSLPPDVSGSSVPISCSAASQTLAFLLDACDKMELFFFVFSLALQELCPEFLGFSRK